MNSSPSGLPPHGNSGAIGTTDTPTRNIGVKCRGRQEIAALFICFQVLFYKASVQDLYLPSFFAVNMGGLVFEYL